MKRTFADFEDKEKLACFSDENDKKPNEIGYTSHKKCKFICNKCKHVFEKDVGNITRKIQPSWCSFCANKKLCKDENCKMCFDKSFASFHDKKKIESWSEKNGKLKPRDVFLGTPTKCWFSCKMCKHVFKISISHITGRLHWCSFCANQSLCDDKNCKLCFDKSFASFDPDKVSCWIEEKNKRIIKSKDNKEIEVFIKPRDVFLNSNKKYWFNCNKCAHHFEQRLNDVKQRRWCKFCANKELCKEKDNCKTCFMKSFASFYDKDKVGSWSKTKNGKLKPCDVFLKTHEKAFFDCFKCGKEFDASINHVTENNGTWCPTCARKYNKNIEAIISKLKDESIEYYPEIPIKIKGRNLSWDIQIKIDNEIFYIESDGKQHFFLKNMMGINRTKDKEKGMKLLKCQRTRDLLKEDYIRNSGNLLFRISYRQLKKIPKLIDEMVKRSKSGENGVFYMDNIYWNKIEDQ